MRTVAVTMTLTEAWEVWNICVPDDAPTDPQALRAYVQANHSDLEKIGLDESGASSYTITAVEEA